MKGGGPQEGRKERRPNGKEGKGAEVRKYRKRGMKRREEERRGKTDSGEKE